ncbi:MAG: HNH endonuclease, partial [Mycobacterium sp.]
DIAAASPTPRRTNHRLTKATRTAATRAGMAAKRAANTETRQLNRARTHKIELRQWRTNFRRTHRVLNGGHTSTSRWCPWINDPLEDEHIPADW